MCLGYLKNIYKSRWTGCAIRKREEITWWIDEVKESVRYKKEAYSGSVQRNIS